MVQNIIPHFMGEKKSFGFNDYGLLYGYELSYAVKKQNNII